MSTGQSSIALQIQGGIGAAAWFEALLGLATGAPGGRLADVLVTTTHHEGTWIGALFGMAIGRCFASRSTSPGAGLIWGVSCAFLLWVIFPAGMRPLFVHSTAMLRDARERFPELVAYLVCLGLPVGTALGLHGSLRYKVDHPPFRWGRAVIAGGLAGIIAGLIFSRWMYEGNFFPLLAGIGQPGPGSTTVTIHFGVALLIGATFGLLFQRDVRGYGSSMGWGLGYAILCWFLGQLSLLPAIAGIPLDWSADKGAGLFGSLVGHIIYGLILGVVYATLDRLWVRLFIQSDPLNREKEGPGSVSCVPWSGERSPAWRFRLEPGDAGHRRPPEGGGTRHQLFQSLRSIDPFVRQHSARYELRPIIPKRSSESRARGLVGMAVRHDLAVSGADDSASTASHRRL
jgi:hypothetical protein